MGTDGDEALAEYTRQRSYLEAGKQPPSPDATQLTLRELCNKFLTKTS